MVLLDGDKREAELFVYMVAKILEQEHGIQIDAEEWLEAFERNEDSYVRRWLEKLDSLLR
jgi:hypothetical protein